MFSLFIEDLYKNVNINVNMNSESIFLIFTYLNLTDQNLSLRQVKILKSMCSIYIWTNYSQKITTCSFHKKLLHIMYS